MTTPQLSTPTIRPRTWLILWAIVLALESLLLVNNAALDSYCWNVTRWFVGSNENYSWTQIQAHHAPDSNPPFYFHDAPPMDDRFYHRTDRFWQVLKDFGEPVMTVILVILLALYHRRCWQAALVAILATSLAGGTGALIRIIAGRTRPTHTDAANIWELFRGFHNGTDLSFPSGHATLAFALAAVFIYFSPRGKYLFLTLATGTALSRVIMSAHFYSDAIFGAALGFTIGWFVTACTDKFLTRIIPLKTSA